MAESGARCVPILLRLLNGEHFYKAFQQMPYLIPLHAQYTGAAPCKQLYESLPSLEQSGVLVDIALGFTAADLPNTRPSCVAYGATTEQAMAAIDYIAKMFDEIEDQVDHRMLSLSKVVEIAENLRSDNPVILADVQDNPGAGGTSDTTGLLEALVKGDAKGVLMGLFCDPEIAERAHSIGVGSVFCAALGGKSSLPDHAPYDACFEVIALSNGRCRYTGEMYGGGIATQGKTAALRLVGLDAEIDLVVTSIRNQCLDLAQFMHLGLDPSVLQYNMR